MLKETQENEIVYLSQLATRYKKKSHIEGVSPYWSSNNVRFLSFQMAQNKADKHKFQSFLAFLLTRVVLHNEMERVLLGAIQLRMIRRNSFPKVAKWRGIT